MNPLYTAHLIADFLLQPTWLVKLKQRRRYGVVIHALIHFFVMALLTLAWSIAGVLGLIIIAVAHAVIDYIKIALEKRGLKYIPGFLIDQSTHLLVLVTVSSFIKNDIIAWGGEAGKGSLVLFTLFSFSIAWFNLSSAAPIAHRRLARLMLLGMTFAAFTTFGLLAHL